MGTSAQLSASGLSIGYPRKGGALELAGGLEIELKAGEFVCLLGPNGAGKSTLIRTLAGMQAPLGGRLRLGETDYAALSPRQRARMLSVVLTENPPAGIMTAYALVALGRHPYSGWLGGLDAGDRSRIEWALGAVGAEPLTHRPVHELSDGERQKVSIARALAQEAGVMLLDEPTAFLDLPRRVELMSILRNLAQRERIALLLSTHDLELALRFADRLWMLTSGGGLISGHPEALVLDGSFDRVFASENLDWDAEHGSFRAHPTPCLSVHLEGEGLPRIWTRRALERLGFGIAGSEREAVFTVAIESTAGGRRWRIRRDGETRVFESITAWIDWTRSEDWRPLG